MTAETTPKEQTQKKPRVIHSGGASEAVYGLGQIGRAHV